MFDNANNRNQTEQALHESEARFRSLIESAPEGIFVQSAGRFRYLNPAACRLFGASRPEDLLGKDFMERMAPEFHALIRERIRLQRETGKPAPLMEQEYLRLDGSRVPVETTAVPVRYQGEDAHIVFVRDVTERRKFDAALRESERFLNDVVENVPDMIFVKDAQDLRFVRFNKAGEQLLGYRRESLLGKNDYDLFPRQEAAFFIKTDQEVLANKRPHDIPEEKILTAGKGERILHTKKITILDESGKPKYLLGISEDITERKQAEAALANLHKLESLGTLAGGIAHDFNNIISSIMGNLSMLQSDMKSGGESLELVEEAQQACETAKGLAQQLLTFAKGGSPVVKVMDLRPLLARAAGFATRGSKTRCVFELDENPLPVNVDKEQVAQVIQNLVLNAMQAMPEGKTIAIRAAPVTLGEGEHPPLAAGRYVQVEVEDQGTGIPQEHLPRVFDPYFSTKTKGRGLGLAMCYSIMSKHGGHISAASKPRSGAILTLLFPAVAAEDIRPEPERPALIAGQGAILVMEDEALVAKTLKRMLARLGYRPESVENGQDALDAYRQAQEAGQPYAAVIMDLTIPGGMGGEEAMGKLLALDPKAKAIVSSGYSNDPIMAEYAAHGFSGVLGKPYRIEDVSAALRRVIGSDPGRRAP